MLSNQYNFNPNQVTVTQVVANLGAISGGTVVGYCSQIFGRRFSIIFISVIGGALLYPYTFVGNNSGKFTQFYLSGILIRDEDASYSDRLWPMAIWVATRYL
jgi:SHS family lactate transporter-like MFS transporter